MIAPAFGAGDRASAATARYEKLVVDQNLRRDERLRRGRIGRAPERADRGDAHVAVGAPVCARRDRLRDVCAIHAIGELKTRRDGGVVGDERERGFEALGRGEEDEHLAGRGAQANIGLGDRRASEGNRALVAELGERNERGAAHVHVRRLRSALEHVERAQIAEMAEHLHDRNGQRR